MKRKFVVIISLVLTLFIAIGTLCGCDLVTTNTERDMNQIVADVNIGDKYKGETEHIIKKDLLIGYMNYGYYYVQQGSYTNADMFNMIMDNLVNQRILIQTAKAELNTDDNRTDWSAKSFVTDSAKKNEVEYNSYKSIEDLVKSYMEKETVYKDDSDVVNRTAPSGATNYVEEIDFSDTDLINGIIKDIKDNIAGEKGSKRNIAYYKVLRLLESNQLLGDNYKEGEIFTTYYFDYLLESNYESVIVRDFEQKLLDNASFNKLTYTILQDVFAKKYEAQEKAYKDLETLKTSLSSASKTAPVLYVPDDANIGYVWNLLIGATEEQTKAIGEITEKDNELRKTARDEILDNGTIVMKDMRSSWIYSNYDMIFDSDLNTTGEGTVNFVNDYSFTDKGIPFQGTVKWLNKGDYTQEYSINADGKYVIKYKVNDKIDEDYVPELRVVSLDEVYGSDIETKINEFIDGNFNEDIIKDLIFAFSTDGGSLSSLDGYVLMDKDEKTTYVKEFQEDGETILNKEQGESVLSKTDYGYHFMYLNKMAKSFDSLEDYCLAVDGVNKADEEYFNYLMANWAELNSEDTDSYMYYLANIYMQDILSNYETELERVVNANEVKVIRYLDKYSDLLGE